MQNSILFKNTKISFSDVGKGSAVVFLHGFLENSTIWNTIIPEISKKNRVVTIDLLGHGQTENIGYIHSMELMAAVVDAVLKHLKIRRVSLVGHSMGGYVSLAFADKYTKKVKGICLLNSTAFADDEARKKIRTQAKKIAQNSYEPLVKMSFLNLFSPEGNAKFPNEIKNALKSALETNLQGYLACQEGMKQRKNRQNVLKNGTFKKLIITGKKDTLLNLENSTEEAKNANSELVILSGGHMSSIENAPELLKTVKEFVRN